MRIAAFLLLLLAGAACGRRTGPDAATPRPGNPLAADPVPARIDSLRRLARPGDLLLRLGDDMLSYSIRFLSEQDPSYSHAGLVVEQNGRLAIAHIGPYEGGRDTLQYEPIDSFLSPAKNLAAGLYRFRISDTERARFLASVETRRRRIHFDYQYDLRSEDKLYCTELIAKSLAAATGNRMRFPGKLLPPGMQKLMRAYLARVITDTAEFRRRPFISPDQLYTGGHCDSLIKISLRTAP